MRGNIYPTVAALVFMCLAPAAARATIYNTESAFVSALAAGSSPYLEDFTSFVFGKPLNGNQKAYIAPGASGYGWTATAAFGLYSNTGALSANQTSDPLTITFTGKAVTAVGGFLSDTDENGDFVAGNINIALSDGTHSVVTTAATGVPFWGYTSSTGTPITSIVLTTDGSDFDFQQVDHFYTATASVPEPAGLAMLTAAIGLAAARRRR